MTLGGHYDLEFHASSSQMQTSVLPNLIILHFHRYFSTNVKRHHEQDKFIKEGRKSAGDLFSALKAFSVTTMMKIVLAG